ncbi:MAG: radical SAM protein [Bacteroides sp.]|nr:radical SAM protein [Bacteroides sp.]
MKATVTDIYPKDRVLLYEQVPLDTPFAFKIEPSSYCNLKCKYCAHALSKEEMKKHKHIFANMSDQTFDLVVEQLKEFPRPVKALTFGGLGEPMLHNKLPDMIYKIHENHVAERIHLITNGTLLTHELTHKLIDAKLNTMKISLQGLSDESYYKNCGVKINFKELHQEIKYLFQNKGDLKIGIKIPNTCLNDGEEPLFYDLFGDCCDEIGIEKIIPIFPGVDYSKIISGETPLSRFNLEQTTKRKVCSVTFYRLSVCATGKVMACCVDVGLTSDNMDIYKQSLVQIWNGSEHREMMKNNLLGIRSGITEPCQTCVIRDDTAYKEDMLDEHAEEIYERLCKLD